MTETYLSVVNNGSQQQLIHTQTEITLVSADNCTTCFQMYCISNCTAFISQTMKTLTNEINAQRRRKQCVLAVVRGSQKFSPRSRPPSRGRGTAKI